MYSRHARYFDFPQEILHQMPSVYIDGELWFGRGKFNETSKFVLDSFEDISWNFFRFISFDCPYSALQNEGFESRYSVLLSNLLSRHPFIQLSPNVMGRNKEHMTYLVDEILKKGGEGIILRQPNSIYQIGRSYSFWKFKAIRDNEALVIARNGHKYTCRLENSQFFYAEAEDNVRNEIQMGDVISYQSTNHTPDGIPVHPKIYRVRHELNWGDVVNNHYTLAKKSADDIKFGQKNFSEISPDSRNPPGYWTKFNGENMRKFLDEFAESQFLDPLMASHWDMEYCIILEDIITKQFQLSTQNLTSK